MSKKNKKVEQTLEQQYAKLSQNVNLKFTAWKRDKSNADELSLLADKMWNNSHGSLCSMVLNCEGVACDKCPLYRLGRVNLEG